MPRRFLFLAVLLLASPGSLRADAFDLYTNRILEKAPGSPGVEEIKKLTLGLLADSDQALPGIPGSLVRAAKRKIEDKAVSMLLIDRFVTYVEGDEKSIQASGKTLYLFPNFRLQLDLGQVVPEELGGDLRFVADSGKTWTEPLGKAKLYLVTKPLPGTEPKKSSHPTFGETFDPHYFEGTYKLLDDGRRSGSLTLKVADNGDVTGSFYSDKDGKKYDVTGKVGTPKHSIQFTINFPRADGSYQGWLFTGDGKALAGTSRLLEHEGGFYAVRVEEP